MVSEALLDLIADPVVGDWVGHGLTLHTGEHATATCRFCSQPLPAGRLERLEGHFSDRFREFVGRLDASGEALTDASAAIKSLVPEDERLLYPHLQDDYRKACQALAERKRLDLNYLDRLRDAILVKRADPFAPLDLQDVLRKQRRPAGADQPEEEAGQPSMNGGHLGSPSGTESVARVNELIGVHNTYTDELGRELLAALQALETDRVARALPDFRKKGRAFEDAAAKAAAAQGVADSLQVEIDQLQLSISQHGRPAEELNREMAAYLGRDELRFEVQETGYTITRNGEPAMNLSEGERTAIAFMYFLKSLQDIGFSADPGVVVIDDPVSSLDANSLYSAFGFMRDRTRDASQLFVMTHNFTFFRQVRGWLTRDSTVNKDARFYMLECETNNGRRASVIRLLDPLLQRYESEYHYLFKRVHEEAHRSTDDDTLAQFYEIPNIARRLLEAFLAFRAPDLSGRDALQKRLDRMTFKEPSDRFRIERFLQLGSHFDRIGDPEHDLSTLSEARAVLLNILACMEGTDSEHYKGMLSAIGAGGN